jgi:lysophospholipase L1-like esterase
MKASPAQIFPGAVALAAFSLLGCSSNDAGTSSPPSSGGSLVDATTASGGASAGGSSTVATSSGGVTSNGGTPATGGQSQASSVAQGGTAAGGATTSTTGRTGGSVTGGGATGGEITTGGMPTGGKTAAGGTTGATGGKTAAGGATGGAPTGGKTAAGGTTSGGTTTSGTVTIGDASFARVLGASDGKTPVTVWMAGDSTMSGSGCTGGGWGTQFASVFNSSVKVVNSSVAGRSIQTWLYDPNVTTQMDANGECIVNPKTYNPRWTAMLDANTGMKPGDYLFVEFGINDATTTCEAGKTRHVGSALFQTYLTTMAQAAMDRGAQPIFLTSMSGLQCSGSTAQPNRAFGPETKAAGAADNVEVIDMTTISAALYTSLGLCPSSGTSSGASGAFFCNDTTHFEQAGALQIAKAVAKALKDQGIGLGAYVLN